MSAIWGLIPLDKQRASRQNALYLDGKREMEQYKINRVEEYRTDKMNVGCGIQYFTKESVREQLPIVEEKYVYTADCMLDNRREVMEMLKLNEYQEDCPDGRLIFDLYKKKRDGCLNDLLGSYSFAFFDREENVVELVSDIAATRCLYYRFENEILEFSTTLEILLKRKKASLNERWIVDFLALDNLAGMTECEETIYQGIYKVPPATILRFGKNGIEKKCYWNPDTSEDGGKTDEEYKTGLIQVFHKAVKSVLRDGANHMMLSGGLDSSSVVSFAAPMLKEKGEEMYTYTSIPREKCVSSKSYYVNDESEKVRKTAEYFGNLQCEFLAMEDVNPWTEHKEELKCIEIPYKSLQNLLWMKECMNHTQKNGGNIILHGAYGNVTISFSSIEVMFNTWLKNKQFIKFFKECIYFGEKKKIGKKQTLKATFYTMYHYYKKKTESKARTWSEKKKELFGDAYITDYAIEKYDLVEKFEKIKQQNSYSGMCMRDMAKLMKGDIQFSHKGEISTKHSLATGVIMRDPTMDKRVIEYCMRLPVEQFNNGSVQRRLVREYFEDIVPEHITKVEDIGVQSADLNYRFQEQWDQIREDFEKCLKKNIDNRIVDCEKALKDIQEITAHPEKADKFDYVRLGYTVMALEKIGEIMDET